MKTPNHRVEPSVEGRVIGHAKYNSPMCTELLDTVRSIVALPEKKWSRRVEAHTLY